MKNLLGISLFFFGLQTNAQDTTANKTKQLSEIVIIATAPVLPFYNYSSDRQITYNFLSDDHILNNLLQNGYTDTSQANRMFRPIDFYGGNSMGANIGLRALFVLKNNLKNNWKTFIPVTVLYETRGFDDYSVAKQELKRVDTLNVSGEEVYLDSISEKGTAFSFNSESLFIQSGLTIESGKHNVKFSAGLNIGFGIGLKNNLVINHLENSVIQASNQDKAYFKKTFDYSETTVQKVKPVITLRFLMPFCMKLNFKKGPFGMLAEMAPGFEMNQVIKGRMMTRWMFFLSAGVRYRFVK
ncbi:MAG: hypothetical protein V4580_11390 [Bacteroidota bacterium]